MQASIGMEHGGSHREVGARNHHPACHEPDHAAAGRPEHERRPHDPGPHDQRGRDDRILLAKEREQKRRATPHDALPYERRVDGEANTDGRHQLAESDDIRDGLDVHGMHGEDHSRHERRGPITQAAGERRDRERRTGVPEQVHRVEERGVAPCDAPVDGKRGEWKRAIHLPAQIGRPIWPPECPPGPVQRMHEGVPDDDVEIVHREAVPKRGEVGYERAGSDDEVEAAVLTVHGSRQRASARPASGRSQ